MGIFLFRFRNVGLVAGVLAICGCTLDSLGTDQVFFASRNISLGSTLVGSLGLSQQVELVNLGRGAATVGKLTMSGPGAAAFQLTNTCGTEVPGRGRCSFLVAFSPATEGVAKATITLDGGPGRVPQVANISGTGSRSASADVVVYGATPAGVMAAVEAARHGRSVLLLDPTRHVGGMMSNGMGKSDFYSPAVIGGLPKEFYGRIASYYGPPKASRNGMNFEPHIAEATFGAMLSQEKGISVALGVELAAGPGAVVKSGTRITALKTTAGMLAQGKEYIDASYTGDVMAASGVKYVVGRESKDQYGEDLGGVGRLVRMGNQPMSAYVIPGDPASGLIPHVTPASIVGAEGSADNTIMAYNYRLCLSSDPKNQIAFAAPAGYQASEYELMGRQAVDMNPPLVKTDFLGASPTLRQKFDYNNTRSFFSSDEVGANTGYPDGDSQTRAAIEAEQKRYMQGMLYFLTTDPRIPGDVRSFVKGFGLCKDEFLDNGGWPHQMYVREARRMVGAYVLTEKDLKGTTSIPDSIGVGGYTVDDHLHHISSKHGVVHFDAGPGYNPQPYRLPYRILTPQAGDVTNLLVPVEVSSSHVAYSSLRVEVTYMVMGQAAGAAASVALEGNGVVQDVGYGALRAVLDGDGVVVGP